MDYLAFMTKYPAITIVLPVGTRQISLSVISSHCTWYLAVSRPTGTVVGNCEIRCFLAIHDAVILETFRMPFLFNRFTFCSGIVFSLRFFCDPRYPCMAAD
eukprot:627573-Pleurochrysis_carterae.AAC.1